jgi:hypothetical protein
MHAHLSGDGDALAKAREAAKKWQTLDVGVLYLEDFAAAKKLFARLPADLQLELRPTSPTHEEVEDARAAAVGFRALWQTLASYPLWGK